METFLVRVWTPDGAERAEGIRGTAVHLSSGRSITYTRSERLISFLAEAASDADPDETRPQRPPDPSTEE